ncbi:MAG: SUMF1/EgtB/PvdO family nonheme iron enzyme [Bacteroidota bacterium]
MLHYILALLIVTNFAPDGAFKTLQKKMNKDAPPGTVWVRDSLYMDATEITNVEYREYMHWLSGKMDKNNSIYRDALPDTLVWRSESAYNEPFVEIYFRHPAYSNYPLVGVSYDQAVDYCIWRSNMVNENIYRKLNKMEITDPVDPEEIPEYVRYRLPSKEEWEYAARGGLKENDFPWGGYYIDNYKGIDQANYNGIGDEWIFYNDSLKAYQIMPDRIEPVTINNISNLCAPVHSYSPNGYGIYEICGNVAEMVAEKGIVKGGSWKLPGYHLRIIVDGKYHKPENDIGFRCACDVLIAVKDRQAEKR